MLVVMAVSQRRRAFALLVGVYMIARSPAR